MKVLCVVALIVAGGLSITAQERVITESEFTEINTKTLAELYKGVRGPVRVVTERSSRFDNRPELDTKARSVFLSVPDRGSHNINEMTSGGVFTKTETIRLNDRSYVRSGDGAWKEINSPSPGSIQPAERTTDGPRTVGSQDTRVVFKYIGSETYGRRKVQVYSKTETKGSSTDSGGDGTVFESLTTVRVGIDRDYYRHDSKTKTKNAQGISIDSVLIIEAESDPTITVAAPSEFK